jgi:hypothetical protein
MSSSRFFSFIGPQTHDEIIYCADMRADSCGCLEGEDQCDSSVITYGDSDRDGDSDDEQCGKISNYFLKF